MLVWAPCVLEEEVFSKARLIVRCWAWMTEVQKGAQCKGEVSMTHSLTASHTMQYSVTGWGWVTPFMLGLGWIWINFHAVAGFGFHAQGWVNGLRFHAGAGCFILGLG